MGITRVERELARALLDLQPETSRFTVFDEARGGFYSLPRAAVRYLVETVGQTFAESALPAGPSEPLNFGGLSGFLYAGLNWDTLSFYDVLGKAKQAEGFSVAGVVHDLVPIVQPQFSPPGVPENFQRHLYRQSWVADRIICVSHATERDYLKCQALMGLRPLPTATAQSGCAVPGHEGARKPGHFSGYETGRFVLCVGSIEPRKNHALLYRLWRRLVSERRDIAVPLLWAGGTHWAVNDLVSAFRRDPNVYPKFLDWTLGSSENALRWLYDNCRFTVYPSFYEGWGLPVAESLALGKHCIAGTGSSLEEASQGLASHIDPLDGAGWLEEIVRCLTDDGYLREREAEIAQRFKPRSWETAARHTFTTAFGDLAHQGADSSTAAASLATESQP